MENAQTIAEIGSTGAGTPAAAPAPNKKPRKKGKWLRNLVILAVLVAAGYWFLLRPVLSQSQQFVAGLYIPTTVSYQDLDVRVSSTGTIAPIDSYKVTALVKGEVLEAPFEKGDVVEKGDLLYRIDAKDVETNIRQAELSLESAQLNRNDLLRKQQTSQKDRIVSANASGTITKLYPSAGDSVMTGAPIADILDRANMKIVLPFHSLDAATFYVGQAATVAVGGTMETIYGTVDAVAATDGVGAGGTLVRDVTIVVANPGTLSDTSAGTATIAEKACASGAAFTYGAKKQVVAKASGVLETLTIKEGDTVADGQTVGSFEDADFAAQLDAAEITLKNAQLSLSSARERLGDYTITSPISGTIIEKNLKVGDNIDATAATSYLVQIFDLSALTLEMKIDELYVGQIVVGQEVSIVADALEGKTFLGHVDNINISGSTQNGVTTYPVTVQVDAPELLLPGMNVTAEIVTKHVPHVLCVPVDAVARGNVVTLATAGALDPNGTVVDPTKLEERTVTLGSNSATLIEITEGLVEGDVVVTQNAASNIYAAMMGG